jgi:F-type H+-transporting ATPase subunit b
MLSRLLVFIALVAPVMFDGMPLFADDGHGGSADGPSLPGLVPQVDLAFWSLATFLVFLFVLKSTVWGPLQKALTDRESGIRKDLADAEAARAKAADLLKEYESKLAAATDQVKEIIAEARRDAEQTRQDIVATAQKEADAQRQRAVAEIERARDQALSHVFETAATAVADASAKVVGRSLSGDDHERLVREALGEMRFQSN